MAVVAAADPVTLVVEVRKAKRSVRKGLRLSIQGWRRVLDLQLKKKKDTGEIDEDQVIKIKSVGRSVGLGGGPKCRSGVRKWEQERFPVNIFDWILGMKERMTGWIQFKN